MAGSHEVRGSSPLSSTPSDTLRTGCHEFRNHFGHYLDCVVHIFTPDARGFYRLDQLWGEAPARSVG